jgi:putative transposase
MLPGLSCLIILLRIFIFSWITFSRYILNWDVSLELSGKITMNMIKSAFDKFVRNNQDVDSVTLLTDGGAENNNRFVDEFLENEKDKIQKLIAQKDISFSNSMVEAVNMIIKYQHLYLYDIFDIFCLRRHLEYFFPVYNNVKPHGSLNGLTPFEALNYIELPVNRD